LLNSVATLPFGRDGRQCCLTCAMEMIHFSLPRVAAPQVFEDECEVSLFLILWADDVRFCRSANSAFTKCPGCCDFPGIVANVPLPNAVHFYLAVQFHSAAILVLISNPIIWSKIHSGVDCFSKEKGISIQIFRRIRCSSDNSLSLIRSIASCLSVSSAMCIHGSHPYIYLCIHKRYYAHTPEPYTKRKSKTPIW
jgi:hypothetical protein